LSSNRPSRAERGPSGPLFFAFFLLLLSTVSAFAADPLLNWIKSPEAYFATSDELAKWQKEVASPQDAQKFIDEYFHKRGEQFKKDLHTRIEFADPKFALAKTPGSHTAMGRVFILLGPPNEQKTNRGAGTSAAMDGSPLNGRMQDNSVEQGARVTYTWVYKKERLPADLGMSELKIDFNTDTQRGSQFIDNPGLVEPYLRRAAGYFSDKYAAAMTTRSEQIARPTRPSAATPDPLWNATPSLNGAVYTGDAFVSPREAPFYAVDVFLPKDAAAFKEWKSGLFVALIKDASGREVVSQRQQVDLQSYDADGNRYVDRSFALAPGTYEALFALYSPDGITLLSSNRETFEVPAANAARASKLLLTSRVDTLDKQDALDPFTFVAQKYAVRGDRHFRASDKISLFTIIANPTGSPAPQLMQKLTLTRDGASFAKMPFEPAQLAQTGPNTFLLGAAFDAGTFKPGHYKVELQVRDFNAPEGSDLRTKGYVLTNEFDVQ
jgi:GWxTD domain-containing protein